MLKPLSSPEHVYAEFPDISLEQIFEITKAALDNLHSLKVFDDNRCDDYLDTCKTLSLVARRKFRPRRSEFNDFLAENDYVDLFREVWKQNIAFPFLEQNGDEYYTRMRCALVILVNGCDSSTKLCHKMEKHIDEIFKYLDSPPFEPDSDLVRIDKNYNDLTRVLMMLLLNIIRHLDIRNSYREYDGVRICKKLQQIDDTKVQCEALTLLAYIMTDKESELIAADAKHINMLVEILKAAIDAEDHHTIEYGTTVEETTETINLMASNDKNKEIIAQHHDALNLYIDVLKKPQNIREQRAAASGLWSFSFNCKVALLSRQNFLQVLTDLKSRDQTDSDVKRSVEGILWELGLTTRNESDYSRAKAYNCDSGRKGKVMLSYQWNHQKEVIGLKQHLSDNGYQVWLDIEQMSGDILDAMAEAVESSDVVIVCYSHFYKNSPNCRSEAKYAHNKKKKIVPVRMQSKYMADGWLGLVISTRLYFDLSTDTSRNENLPKLLVELDNMFKEDKVDGTIAPKQMPTSSSLSRVPQPNDSESAATSMGVLKGLTSRSPCQAAKWNENEVSMWLKQHLPGDTHLKFKDFDGAALMELVNIISAAPDFY